MEKILSHSSKNTTSAVIDPAIHFHTKLGGFSLDTLFATTRHSLLASTPTRGNSNHEVKDEQLRLSEFSHFYHACPAD